MSIVQKALKWDRSQIIVYFGTGHAQLCPFATQILLMASPQVILLYSQGFVPQVGKQHPVAYTALRLVSHFFLNFLQHAR